MPNNNLYLIGTVHLDPKGPKRLEGLLKQISPEIVALEFHKERENVLGKKFIEKEKEIDQLLSGVGLTLTPEQRKTMLDLEREFSYVNGFEMRTSKAYKEANPKSRLEYIDIAIFGDEYEEFVKHNFSLLNESFVKTLQEKGSKDLFLEMLNRGKEDYLQDFSDDLEIVYKEAKLMWSLASLAKLLKPHLELKKEQIPIKTSKIIERIYSHERDEAMANRIRELYDGGAKKVVSVTGAAHVLWLKFRLLDLEPTTMALSDYKPTI